MEKEVSKMEEIFIISPEKFELYGFSWDIYGKGKMQLSLFDTERRCHLVNIDIPDELINKILDHIKNYKKYDEITS